jgi:hypothetical protein
MRNFLASPSHGGSGAGDVIRTRDIFLGKEVLYQLSYTRISKGRHIIQAAGDWQGFFADFSGRNAK